LRDLAQALRITAIGLMASSAAIVHHILHSEAVHSKPDHGAEHDPVQAQTQVLRAILRIARGMEAAWARVVK